MSKKNKYRIIFFITIIFFSSMLALFVSLLIGVLSVINKPSQDELMYETCTYIKYEYKGHKNTRCLIYVSEYDAPLEIDSIVVNGINEEVLKSIKSGDKIFVLLRNFNDKYDLYSISYNEKFVLSYDDYLMIHAENEKVLIIMLSIFISIMTFILAFVLIQYIKTVKVLS